MTPKPTKHRPLVVRKRPRLTRQQVARIEALLGQDDAPKDIAAAEGVSLATVYNVSAGRAAAQAHAEPPPVRHDPAECRRAHIAGLLEPERPEPMGVAKAVWGLRLACGEDCLRFNERLTEGPIAGSGGGAAKRIGGAGPALIQSVPCFRSISVPERNAPPRLASLTAGTGDRHGRYGQQIARLPVLPQGLALLPQRPDDDPGRRGGLHPPALLLLGFRRLLDPRRRRRARRHVAPRRRVVEGWFKQAAQMLHCPPRKARLPDQRADAQRAPESGRVEPQVVRGRQEIGCATCGKTKEIEGWFRGGSANAQPHGSTKPQHYTCIRILIR